MKTVQYHSLKICLAQINPIVGDLRGNADKIIHFYNRALREQGPDLVVFPECSLPGYPAEDLLFMDSFLKGNLFHLNRIAKKTREAALIAGFVHKKNGKVYNAAASMKNGKVFHIYHKHSLPNYSVFDEKRYFSPGENEGIFKVKGVPIGLNICEDMWEQDFRKNQMLNQAKAGAKILVNISASPFYAGKFWDRMAVLTDRVRRSKRPIVYVNMVGGQDELIFDGRSCCLDASGQLVLRSESFTEDLRSVRVEMTGGRISRFASGEGLAALHEGDEEVYMALVLGTRDYVGKNGFKRVVIGVSGGIDSALTACIAADALGKDRVVCVSMPSRYSSTETARDAEKIARNLGTEFLKIPIERPFKAFLNLLSGPFLGARPDITEENLQSRIRGILLMALSNKFGYLVMTTGNKSEVSVGYCTLYGDTAGGFAVLKDVPKTLVYRLSRFVNAKSGRERIPLSVIHRAPTAELKLNQKDQDTLPPYDLLDRIIAGYVEKDRSFTELAREGIPKETLARVIRMVDANEYKRRQSPPGIKITLRAFGKDRRMPITNRFVDRP